MCILSPSLYCGGSVGKAEACMGAQLAKAAVTGQGRGLVLGWW